MAREASPVPAYALPGRRRGILALIALSGVWAAAELQLFSRATWPPAEIGTTFAGFFRAAFAPALTYQSTATPADAVPFIQVVFDASRRTVVFAVAALSLALPLGLVLGFFASKAWWDDDPLRMRSTAVRIPLSGLRLGTWTFARILIALLRSIHELLWAVVFLAAMGLTDLAAVVAIALPYAGTLAKIFAEMVDEAPRDAARVCRNAGASGLQTFFFALVPRAIPDMGAYTLYRFECGLRSSAILGFFGPETLGKFIKQAWNENHYNEVWTYLYALFVLVGAVEWASGKLRARFAA
jgi:phosphonate transport system permease protein